MFIAVATGNILNHLHVSVAPLLKKKIYLRLYFCLTPLDNKAFLRISIVLMCPSPSDTMDKIDN